MINDLVLLRLLQGGSALAFVGLLCLLGIMRNKPLWLRLPIWLLCLSCITTFFTTMWIPSFILFIVIVTIFILGIVSIVSVLDYYLQPISFDKRSANIRRLLWYSIPTIGILFTIWAFSATVEGGLQHLVDFERKLDLSLDNQETMKRNQETLKQSQDSLAKMVGRNYGFIQKGQQESTEYRKKLNKDIGEIRTDVGDQRVTVEWLKLQQQKQTFKSRAK